MKVRALILIVAVFGTVALHADSGNGSTGPTVDTEVESAATAVTLLVGRSTLVEVGTPIARVSLTSADVADALVTSPSQLLVHGKEPGSISMFVWERAGGVHRYEVAVERDLTRLRD